MRDILSKFLDSNPIPTSTQLLSLAKITTLSPMQCYDWIHNEKKKRKKAEIRKNLVNNKMLELTKKH